jgi:NADH-quinone oxidoreductase subunit G
MVNLEIDGVKVEVPEGTLVVDAAKKVGIHIPVFCYHPKLEPVGMCRMCLVEIGRPVVDRSTGEFERDASGALKIGFGPKLETACTVPVSEGMVVRGFTENVKRARKDILEFLLTSHPLDCPICDKGGECPLQNLTMDFGPGKSRFIYDEKQRLAKQVPLGDLIYLDRERCIQCGRCVRFQNEIVDDPVIGFAQRGRALQIVSFSNPGFDSYFSGNTTDICPVGALTTTDFRFQARPWELNAAASICQQCPVGCNLTVNVRREHKTGGTIVVKRILPRQNEWVNEIWICDKGRFAYHYAENSERLTKPLARRDGEFSPVTWEEATSLVAQQLKQAGSGLLTLASGRLSNEDLFNLKQLTDHLGGTSGLYTEMAGGDLVAQVGVGEGTNFSDLGVGSAVLVVASDLEEEAPIYWLRVKQAAERGAKLIVVNPRRTKTERHAAQVLRYPYGSEAAMVLALINSLSAKRPDLPEEVRSMARPAEIRAAAKTLAEAENLIVLFGSEGIGLEASHALAQACANLLIATDHTGRPNNGMIAVWPRANDQGAWDMGFRPLDDLPNALKSSRALYIAGADPAGDDPQLAKGIESAGFLVVQDLFLTETAKLADVVLPAQSFLERDGSLTSGERRVQRYYPAIPVHHRPTSSLKSAVSSTNGGEPHETAPLADFAITARIAANLGLELEGDLAMRVMERIAASVPDYVGLSYKSLSEVEEQWPIIARADLYYGGTSYENSQGLGIQLQPAAQRGEPASLGWRQPPEIEQPSEGALLAVPATILYDRGSTVLPSKALAGRIPEPYVALHPRTGARFDITDGSKVNLVLNELTTTVQARLDETIPEGIVLVPRSMGVPLRAPTLVKIAAAEPDSEMART